MLVEDTVLETGGGSAESVRQQRLEAVGAWRRDVALEMWIDVTTDPVVIRLSGVLDQSTGANLLRVVEDCVADGHLDIDLDTRAVRVDGSGRRVIDAVRVRVVGCGGRLLGGGAEPA